MKFFLLSLFSPYDACAPGGDVGRPPSSVQLLPRGAPVVPLPRRLSAVPWVIPIITSIISHSFFSKEKNYSFAVDGPGNDRTLSCISPLSNCWFVLRFWNEAGVGGFKNEGGGWTYDMGGGRRHQKREGGGERRRVERSSKRSRLCLLGFNVKEQNCVFIFWTKNNKRKDTLFIVWIIYIVWIL